MEKNYIFGAKATAASLFKALKVLQPETAIEAFLVSERAGNPDEIWGCPVRMLNEVSDGLSEAEKEHVCIYVAVPELIHGEIRDILNKNGFYNLVMLDSVSEAKIMGDYFKHIGRFDSVHELKCGEGGHVPKLTIYAASFYKDKILANPPKLPEYIKTIYLGCDQAKKAGVDLEGKADFYDNTGDNISANNPNRCEMTAYYWIWKNRLDTDDEYVGVCHYRRLLDLSDDDLRKIKDNDIDVILPYPMIHYPNSGIQHTWYVKDGDWDAMIRAVKELYPEYEGYIDKVFSTSEFYNYNIMLAKKKVFSDYCNWIFPIFDRLEELSDPKGNERSDRYTAYLGESLTTLYFMANIDKLKISHTGRLLFS